MLEMLDKQHGTGSKVEFSPVVFHCFCEPNDEDLLLMVEVAVFFIKNRTKCGSLQVSNMLQDSKSALTYMQELCY